jgi:Putative Flp pilus-assembly TadE/G-like
MKFNKQSGQVLIGTAFVLVVLAGFAGLAIDMGTLRYQKRLEQTAADGAAIAGAQNLLAGGGVFAGALTASAQNGFTDGGTGSLSDCGGSAPVGTTCVEVKNPPLDVTFNGKTYLGGPHTGNADYVEVLVVKVQPTYFMKIFGKTSEPVLARAVATNTGGGVVGGAGCIYTLGTPNKKLNVQNAGVGGTGNVIVNGPTCGIVDNGNFVANGSVQIKAGGIGVGGAYNGPSQQGDCSGSGLPSTGVCPAPVTGMPYSGDPFKSKYPIPGAPGAGTVTTSGTVTTYTPGSYTDITINSGTQAVFSPGLYYITGTFRINGGAKVCGGGIANFALTPFCTEDTVNGGVTFFLAGSSSSVSINGTSAVEMFAPNSGTYEGLLFYQDPANTNLATINGTNESFFQGAVYMPSADLEFAGTAGFNSGAKYTVIVTDQLLVKGGPEVNLKSDFSGLANGGGPLTGATKWATLVE